MLDQLPSMRLHHKFAEAADHAFRILTTASNTPRPWLQHEEAAQKAIAHLCDLIEEDNEKQAKAAAGALLRLAQGSVIRLQEMMNGHREIFLPVASSWRGCE